MNNIILIIIISIMLSACVPVAPGSLSAQMLTATPTAAPTRAAPVLTATPAAPIGVPTPSQDMLTLVGLHNCRAEGNVSAPVLAVLPDGAVLAVLARIDGWALVVAAGTPCWVAAPAGD